VALGFVRHPYTLGVTCIYHYITATYRTHTLEAKALIHASFLRKEFPIENRPPISIMMPGIARYSQKPVLHIFRVYTAIFGVNLLHLLPLLALRLPLFDTQLLEVDVRTIVDAGSVAIDCTFLATESRQLACVEGSGRIVERCGGCAEECCLGYTGFLEVRVNLPADVVACIYRCVSTRVSHSGHTKTYRILVLCLLSQGPVQHRQH
jgi:hypothetical protein